MPTQNHEVKFTKEPEMCECGLFSGPAYVHKSWWLVEWPCERGKGFNVCGERGHMIPRAISHLLWTKKVEQS